MLEITDRQAEILNAARVKGRVIVEDLATAFDVTPQTIRRDLNELCDRGLLSRVHGGAVPANSISNIGYAQRRAIASEGKEIIGRHAASLIPESCSVILNIGTTTEHVARYLYDHRNLVVISNNINVINILSGSPQKELILAGGLVRQSDGGIVGEAAVEFMRGFKVDYAVVGASALDLDGDVLDFDYREVSVARAIIENARRTILVADATKFDRTAPVRVCGIDAVDIFVTDSAPPAAFAAACRAAGVAIEIAGEAPVDE